MFLSLFLNSFLTCIVFTITPVILTVTVYVCLFVCFFPVSFTHCKLLEGKDNAYLAHSLAKCTSSRNICFQYYISSEVGKITSSWCSINITEKNLEAQYYIHLPNLYQTHVCNSGFRSSSLGHFPWHGIILCS